MEITLKEFADKYNTVLTRRKDKKMTESYLYRIIREDFTGKRESPKATTKPRALWFQYKFSGEKDAVRIIIPD